MRYENVLNEIFGLSKKEKHEKRMKNDPEYRKKYLLAHPEEMERWLLGTKKEQEKEKKKAIKTAEFADKYSKLKKSGKEKKLQKLVRRYAY